MNILRQILPVCAFFTHLCCGMVRGSQNGYCFLGPLEIVNFNFPAHAGSSWAVSQRFAKSGFQHLQGWTLKPAVWATCPRVNHLHPTQCSLCPNPQHVNLNNLTQRHWWSLMLVLVRGRYLSLWNTTYVNL